MPLALEPNQRFPIVLSTDESKPQDSRPTFYARSMTMRQQVAMQEDVDRIFEDAIKASCICDRTVAILEANITGWSHMGEHEFGKADFRDFLTHTEAMELVRKIMANNHLKPEEKKS